MVTDVLTPGAGGGPRMRRSGLPTSSALAYWMGNPVHNPVVLVFLAILLPWQWVTTRLVVGALLVFVLTAWVARLAARPAVPADVVAPGMAGAVCLTGLLGAASLTVLGG
jgi:uncharacterized membrane protein YraQ (UPF0718 family)